MTKILLFRGSALVCFLVSLLFAASFCNADGRTVEVVGVGECADCAENNFETSQAFSGLRVTIDCKPENGEFKTRGSGELDKEGNFKVSLPEDLVQDGKLKEDCYAQLHSASAAACPSVSSGLESSKIVFKSTNDDKHLFGLKGKLKFSPVTCVSASYLPYHKHPALPKLPPLPPLKSFHHPHNYPPFPPIYKKPLPPPVPIYKPPVYKPHPVPVYKPPVYKPPVYKPHPVPVYKPPVYKPHPVPVYKPPVHKPHPVPVYKPPVYKPHPVPVYKKPFPPLPTIPPFPKKQYPPHPKFPPKYVHHPKFGKWPPLPPFDPHHP